MTWDINNFATQSRYHEGGTLTFGDDSKGNIIGIGNIKVGSSLLIENIVLVDGLKHNLLSIRQLYIQGFKVIFDDFTRDILEKNKYLCSFRFSWKQCLYDWSVKFTLQCYLFKYF